MLLLVKKLTRVEGGTEELALKVAKAIRAGYDVTIVAGREEKRVWARVDELLAKESGKDG